MRSKDDHCVYSKQIGDHFNNIVLYVDYMLLIENNKDVIKEVKYQLFSKFDMKDINAVNSMLEMNIRRDHENNMIWLNQSKYVETILQIFNM